MRSSDAKLIVLQLPRNSFAVKAKYKVFCVLTTSRMALNQ